MVGVNGSDQYRPARFSGALALFAALAATGASAPSLLGVFAGLAGTATLAVGMVRPSRRLVSAGCALVFAGVLAAGTVGASGGPGGAGGSLAVLPGVAGALLAWDFGEQAVNVGEQLAPTGVTRSELVHAAGSVLVASVAGAVAVAVFSAGGGGQPLTALVLLLLAVVVLASALRATDGHGNS